MELPKSDVNVELVGNVVEQTFSVNTEDMGLIFEMLRSKMYKNPIAAICREIACNARDANREVGLGEKPIEISITQPNQLFNLSDRAITFQDNGPGITPERMANVFIKYAASTKRTSNEFTGGFGLGAKTPFAYTDTFNIITVVDGIKYWYTSFIDHTKRGKMVLFNQQSTTEPNGTTIAIPIKEEDVRRFELETLKATILWDVQPIYKNFNNLSNYQYEVLYREEKFALFSQKGLALFSHNIIIIDGIVYDVDDLLGYKSFRALDHQGVFALFFQNGELTIAANRETLQYDDVTKAKYQERFNQVADICSVILNKELMNCSTLLEAVLKIKAIKSEDWNESALLPAFDKIVSRALSNKLSLSDHKIHYTWRNISLEKYVNFNFQTYTWQIFDSSTNVSMPHIEICAHLLDNAVYINDLKKLHPLKLATLKAKHSQFILFSKTKLVNFRQYKKYLTKNWKLTFNLTEAEIEKKLAEIEKEFNRIRAEEETLLKSLFAGNLIQLSTVSNTKRTVTNSHKNPIITIAVRLALPDKIYLIDLPGTRITYNAIQKKLQLSKYSKVIYYGVDNLTLLPESSECLFVHFVAWHYKTPVVFVNKNKTKYLQESEESFEDAVKNLPAQETQFLVDCLYFATKNDNYDLSKFFNFNYNSDITTALGYDYIRKITNLTSFPREFFSPSVSVKFLKALEKHKFTPSVEVINSQKIFEKVLSDYPLLKEFFRSCQDHTPTQAKIQHYSNYIKGQNLLLNQFKTQSCNQEV